MKERSNIISGRISAPSGALTQASVEGISVSVPGGGITRIRFPSWFRMKNIMGNTEAGGPYIYTENAYLNDREASMAQYRASTEAATFGGYMLFVAIGDIKT